MPLQRPNGRRLFLRSAERAEKRRSVRDTRTAAHPQRLLPLRIDPDPDPLPTRAGLLLKTDLPRTPLKIVPHNVLYGTLPGTGGGDLRWLGFSKWGESRFSSTIRCRNGLDKSHFPLPGYCRMTTPEKASKPGHVPDAMAWAEPGRGEAWGRLASSGAKLSAAGGCVYGHGETPGAGALHGRRLVCVEF
jgi:hypothetical protein